MAQRENMTAVEWLEYLHKEGILIKKSFEIAKEMEKEQMLDAYNSDRYPWSKQDALKYYTETYSDGKKD